jgi:hypothetical protein
MLDAWMSALAPFATENRRVTHISWTHRRATSELSSRENKAPTSSPTHTTAITLTARTRKSQLRSLDDDSSSSDVAELLRETDSLVRRLVDAGLIVSAPLTALELRQQLSSQLDNTSRASRRTLALVTTNYKHSMSSGAIASNHVRCGSTLHRSYWIESWPRHELEPNWLESLLLAPTANYTFTVICEPVAPSASRRAIDRKATKLTTDAEQRSRAGFRVGQEHENAATAVANREVELASGHVEFAFVGIVSVSATSEERLRNSCTEFEHAAAATGVGLRPLDGHHDEGLTYALPVGAAPSNRWIS